LGARWNHTPPGRKEIILALATTITVMLGSLLFLYATLFMAYLPATMFVLAGWYIFERSFPDEKDGPHPPGPKPFLVAALIGYLFGWAILCEYTYALAVGLLAVAMGLRTRRWTLWLPMGIAMAVALLPFFIYTMTIFGRPVIPYEYEALQDFREQMSHGIMGATIPRLNVLWLLTFHPFRGLFVQSPLLLAGGAGLLTLCLRPVRHLMALACVIAIVVYLLFNSAYYMWWGGWAFGPRILAPAIPLLAAGTARWWRNRFYPWYLAACGIFSISIHMIVNSVDPQPTDHPWFAQLLYPSLRQFDYPNQFLLQIWPRFVHGQLDTSLGQMLMHLSPNQLSLAPLAFWWLIFAILLARIFKSITFDQN
jgi:hypothetical protein